MFMEPDEQQPEYSVERSESRVVYSTERNGGFVPIVPNYSSISRAEIVAEPAVVVTPNGEDRNPVAAEQQFFPSYFRSAPPLGHSRPYPIQLQPQQNPAAAIAGRYSVGGRAFDQSLLGNGDFSVMRGGTFYPDGERPYRQKFDDFFSAGSSQFYNLNNGHGRPNAQPLTAPPPSPFYPEDPFANFRDFAEINSGGDPAFSHYVVVYANKNATKPHPTQNTPKNIFEQLQLLDLDQDSQRDLEETPEFYTKKSKLSKFKTKLSATKMEKKYKKKLSPKLDSVDYSDPLIAES